MIVPDVPFEHLDRLSDERGIFEHAEGTKRRVERGYCTDDNARLLVVATRETESSPVVDRLAGIAARFLAYAQGVNGDCHNRLSDQCRWTDRPGVEDCWGRSLWGFGTAAARSPHDAIRRATLAGFERGARRRSRWPRAMAFAALGAVEVLDAHPGHRGARALLADAVDVIGNALPDPLWPWPEPRLAYANAALPEVMIAAGVALHRDVLLRDGLTLLAWLVDHETSSGHLSVTPVGGSGPGDHRPAFDQQPIEVAAIADACARAFAVTGERRWARALDDAVGWFLGENDCAAMMIDLQSGGGYDGLQPDGPNGNQGAESTLALVSTLQHAHSLVSSP